jgi:hypothetical protein
MYVNEGECEDKDGTQLAQDKFQLQTRENTAVKPRVS